MDPNWDSDSFSAGTLDCLLCKESLEYVNGDRSDLLDHLNNIHQTKIHQNLILAITFLDNNTLNIIIGQFEKHNNSVNIDENLLEEIDSEQDTIEMIEENGDDKENEVQPEMVSDDVKDYEEIITSSEYFKMNPKQMTSTINPDLHFGDLFPLVDLNLPSGWKVRDYQTPSGKDEKHFLAPDGRVIKSKRAVIEYMKIMEKCSVDNIITVSKHFEKPTQPFFGDLWNHLTPNENSLIDEVKPESKKRQKAKPLKRKVISKETDEVKPIKRRVISKETDQVKRESDKIVEVKGESEEIVEIIEEIAEILEIKKTSTSGGLNQTKLSGVTFNCEHCSYKTTSISNFEEHLKSAHEVILFNCKHCDYMTIARSQFKLHNNSVHGGLNIKCEHCSFKATKQGSLEQHTSTVHIEEPIPPFFGNMWNHFTSKKATLKDEIKLEGHGPGNPGSQLLQGKKRNRGSNRNIKSEV